jgi:NADH:ubiquinone oxidoreductase subunit 3 (subunit A)
VPEPTSGGADNAAVAERPTALTSRVLRAAYEENHRGARVSSFVSGSFCSANGGRFLSRPNRRAIVRPSLGTNFTNGDGVLHDYGQIGILVIIALIFPLGALVTSWAFRSLRIRPGGDSNPVKDDIYECGLRTEGPSLVQFNFRYYYIALLFVLFDVEIVFLFPWALVFDKIGVAAYFEGILFIGILCLGILYAWRKRALEWRL